MNLHSETLLVSEAEGHITIVIDGKTVEVDRVARVFPKTHPDGFISFLDTLGHEIGLLETTNGMLPDSKGILNDHLRRLYFVPTIEEILSVESSGTASTWRVVTNEGERAFSVASRDALDGDRPPEICVTDLAGRRYKIRDYWGLDKDSRQAIVELLPDKIIKSKLVARNSSGMTMRMR